MTNTKVNHPAVVKAAKALRIKIHRLDAADHCNDPKAPANARWLDSVLPDDAEIIERETKYSRLVEAAKLLGDTLDAIDASDSCSSIFTLAYVHGCKYNGPNWTTSLSELRSVLAEINDLGNGPRR